MLAPAPAPTLAFDALDHAPDEVERRVAWSRARRGREVWFWPELPVDRWRAALRETARVAGRLLADPAAAEVLDADGRIGAEAIGIAGLTSGMASLLGWWAEAGALRAEPRTAALLALHLEHGRRRFATLERETAAALRLLAGAGLECVVVKGMHTASALFPDPGARPMADVDLVVPAGGAAAAAAALRAAGYTALPGSHRGYPYHDHWVPPGAPRTLRSLSVSHAHNPYEVNLRDTLRRSVGGFGRLELGEPETERVEVAGVPARVLARPHLVAYLAAHASLNTGSLQMVRLAELVLAARAGVDWDALKRLLRETGTARFTYPALVLAEGLAPGSFPPDFLAFLQRETGPRVRRRVRALRPATAQTLGGSAWRSQLFLAESAGEHLRSLARAAFPAADPRRLASIYARRLARLLPRLRGG